MTTRPAPDAAVPLLARGGPPGLRRRLEQPLRRVARGVRDGAEARRFARWRQRNPDARVERPVFVVGCPRSGTSLVVNLLGRHPELDTWTEAGRVWDPHAYDDPEADHAWDAERATPGEVERLHARFEYHRVRSGRPRFANKHPRTSVRLPFVAAAFPDAVVVNVVRDGRATAASIVDRANREPWRRDVPFAGFCKPPGWRELRDADPVREAARQWREIVREVDRRRPLFASRWVDVHYEDVCADPRAAMARVHAQAGLDERVDDLPAALPRRDDAWRTRLDATQQATLVAELGDEVERQRARAAPDTR